jgi:heptosyltransferase II
MFFSRSLKNLHKQRQIIASAALVGSIRGWLAIIVSKGLRLIFPRKRHSAQGELKSVLVVKLDELGDVAMALPLLGGLRTRIPSAHITVVLNTSVVDLLQNVPGVTVLGVNVKCNSVLRPLILPIRYYLFVRRQLRMQRFDACLLPRREADDVFATVLGYFTDSSRLVSFTEQCSPRKSRINRSFDLLLTDTLPVPPVQPETHSNMLLLECLGLAPTPADPWLPIFPDAREFAQNLLPESREKYVVICPTSGHSELKQWGTENFAQVAAALARSGKKIVLLGVRSEAYLGESIQAAVGQTCINLIGKTSVQQMVAVLDRCTTFIGNDAGPMHVASALGKHIIAVFGPSCHHRYGPWGGPNSMVFTRELDCSPCRAHQTDRCIRCVHPERLCLTQIQPAEVLEAWHSTVESQQ